MTYEDRTRNYKTGMSGIRYTIRSVPEHIDRALREHAAETGQGLNAVVLEVLERGVARVGEPVIHHDLDFAIGTWVEDPEFDAVMEEFAPIDPEIWRTSRTPGGGCQHSAAASSNPPATDH